MRQKCCCCLFSLCVIFALSSRNLIGTEKRPVTVEDCVGLHRILWGQARISPDGRRAAWVVKTPSLVTDENRYQVWVRSLKDVSKPPNGSMIFASTKELTGLTWLSDGMRIAFVVNGKGRETKFLFVNIDSHKAEVVAEISENVRSFSISGNGEAIAYAEPRKLFADPEIVPTAAQAARGFYVPFKYPEILANEKRGIGTRFDVVVLNHVPRGKWERTLVPAPPSAPASGSKNPGGFDSVFDLSLSPDGGNLAFIYRLNETPELWRENRVVQAWKQTLGSNPVAVALYDIRKAKLHDHLDFPYARGPIRWSGDSRSLVLPAASPVSSEWEKQDAQTNLDPREGYHLFATNVGTFDVSEVLGAGAAGQGYAVVSWKQSDGEMVVERSKERALVRMHRDGQEWQESGSTPLPPGTDLESVASNDGEVMVGIRQAPTVPPDLVVVDVKTGQMSPLTDLNPEIRDVTLGDIEKAEWTTRYGGKISGTVIKPVAYQTGHTYPLVIMLTWPTDGFVCDGYYSTAFPPQPLANDGFLVLIFNVYNVYSEDSRQPEGPPAIQEAQTMMASVEAAINFLANEGLADKNNVGIIGFSRSSWKVDYILTHSDFRFRAASSADSGIYNYGALWLFDGSSATDEYEAGYGGLPYGDGFQNWFKGAPAFNATKVHTPILMEYTGTEGRSSEPLAAYEFHTALNLLHKPVELFFYPNGSHPLNTPFNRVASLQRNVDWFRFWMQGYERKAPPYDPEQFVRWRELRKLQEEESNASRESPRN